MDNLMKKYLNEGCKSKRLSLRPLTIADAEDMFEYTSNFESCKFLKWGPHLAMEETWNFIEGVIAQYKEPKDIFWGIEYNNKLIGVVRVYNIDMSNRECEISYILNPQYKGNGFMTETIKRVIKFCFEELKLNKIKAFYDSENLASLKVMKRCDMKEIKNISKDVEIKGKLRSIKMCEIKEEQL